MQLCSCMHRFFCRKFPLDFLRKKKLRKNLVSLKKDIIFANRIRNLKNITNKKKKKDENTVSI